MAQDETLEQHIETILYGLGVANSGEAAEAVTYFIFNWNLDRDVQDNITSDTAYLRKLAERLTEIPNPDLVHNVHDPRTLRIIANRLENMSGKVHIPRE